MRILKTNNMSIELSIVMPCLNEAETIANCVNKAKQFLTENQINGEVIIGDNGSTDGSQAIAKQLGAIVVDVKNKGYGNASRGAIDAARGKYVITADTDDSHDLLNLNPFLQKLNEGYDLVMGNRFKGSKQKKAMPFLHRYVGNPALTFVGNLFFKTNVGDFHCGLRGFTKDAYNKMELSTSGMEFASEIVVKASMLKMKICEVPTTVFPSGRSRKPHLRSFPDGWRHLRFLLLYSPKWLFLFPGIILSIFGFVATITMISDKDVTNIKWLVLASSMFLIGFQFIIFYALTKIYATNHGLIPKTRSYNRLFDYFTLERGLLIGFVFTVLGLIMAYFGLTGDYSIQDSLKKIVPSVIAITLGIQLILFSFFFSVLGLNDDN